MADRMVMAEEKLLEIRGLETSFGPKVVHHDLSLDIIRGEVLVLLGGSGSGKSTLLRTLIGLEVPTAGTCMFEGKDLFQLDERAWKPLRRQIAYAFQGGALFDSLTVEENLNYPLLEHANLTPAAASMQIAAMLTKFGLAGCEKLLPANLSGGMQKRVGLARATMLDPTIILYDEPTAGLDPAMSRKVAETILALHAEGKTSVLVTHDTVTALHVADRVAFIHGGGIAVVQTRAALEAEPHPLIEAYLEGREPT